MLSKPVLFYPLMNLIKSNSNWKQQSLGTWGQNLLSCISRLLRRARQLRKISFAKPVVFVLRKRTVWTQPAPDHGQSCSFSESQIHSPLCLKWQFNCTLTANDVNVWQQETSVQLLVLTQPKELSFPPKLKKEALFSKKHHLVAKAQSINTGHRWETTSS